MVHVLQEPSVETNGAPYVTIKSDTEPFICCEGRYELYVEGTILQEDSGKVEKPENYIAALFVAYGTHAFSMLRGSFSIIIYDTREQTVYGARDHFGIQPLYYMETGQHVQVAHQKEHVLEEKDHSYVSTEAMQHYFSFQYVPQPMMMTAGIQALQAGHFFMKKIDEPLELTCYFHAAFTPTLEIGEELTITRIREALINAVHMCLPKNETVGIFLSGGIDSSVIASIAQQYHSSVKAFSVEFDEKGYSEIEDAKETAEMLGIEHFTYTVTAEEFMDIVPELIAAMDAPIADPSCVPLYVAAREAQKHVDVILSGEGADELFGGYNMYREHESIKYVSQLPDPLLRAIQSVAMKIPEGMKGRSFLLRASTPLEERYIGNAKIFEENEKKEFLYPYDSAHAYCQHTRALFAHVEHAHPAEKMQYIDVHTWLPGDILAKAHAMARTHSLDVRMPFLDLELFFVAKHTPVDQKIKNNTTKYVLREAAKGLAPAHTIAQKKLGFPVPIRKWLKDELYDWAMAIIQESKTTHLIDPRYARRLLETHARGKIDYSRKIWAMLIFMVWYERHISHSDRYL